MKATTQKIFPLKRLAAVVAVPILFFCQSPIDPPDTSSDLIEFESVWQWCKALSIYQDSSAFEGRIPSNPFVFSQPEYIMLAIHDTLKGGVYTDYDWFAINHSQGAVATVAAADSSTVFFDRLSASTAMITITTFEGMVNGRPEAGKVYNDFLLYVDTLVRFQNIVVDVRDNGGGFINEAVSIIEAFVPAQTPYLLVRNRDFDDASKKYVTRNWHPWTTGNYPIPGFENKHIAVLMNGYSASASEIMAAGLYEGKKAPLIGSQSYGKGMGQNGLVRRTRLPLLITSLFFKGVSSRIGDYHRRGIEPDTVPQPIKHEGDSLYADDWHRQIFYAVKMLDSTTTGVSINFPPLRRMAAAPLRKAAPCYYKTIYEDGARK
jgi:hypothetical protein